MLGCRATPSINDLVEGNKMKEMIIFERLIKYVQKDTLLQLVSRGRMRTDLSRMSSEYTFIRGDLVRRMCHMSES